MKLRKTRSDSKLMALPQEQFEQLKAWMLENMPYSKLLDMLKQEPFCIKTSYASLSAFYNDVCMPELLARRQAAVSTANQLKEHAAKMPGTFDEVALDSISQAAYEVCSKPGTDSTEVFKLGLLLLKIRDQRLKKEELILNKAKFEVLVCEQYLKWIKDDRARQIADSVATNAEKIAALRQAYFADVDAMDKSGEVQLPK